MDYNQNNYYGQQPYNNYNYSEEYRRQQMIFARRNFEKAQIKTIGKTAGLCIIGYVVIQNIIALPVFFSKTLNELYDANDVFTYAFSIILTVFGLLLPFWLGGLSLKKKTRSEIYLFDKPKSLSQALLFIPAGFTVCILANIPVYYLVSFLDNIGIELSTPDLSLPSSKLGIILYTLSVAVLSPVVEEFAVRGCIMQPMRRFGDTFAIISSSVIFAVLHGNLIQAPFAFIAGLALGYVCCKTNSLWPGIIIHFLNNLYSVALEIMTEYMQSEELLNTLDRVFETAIITIGILCAAYLFFKLKNNRLNQSNTIIGAGEKTSSLILNAPMIISLIIMLIITSQYVKIK